jgi:hypothetical protein
LAPLGETAASFNRFFETRPLDRNETTKQMETAQIMERAQITQISRIKFLIAECGIPSASMLTLMSVEN